MAEEDEEKEEAAVQAPAADASSASNEGDAGAVDIAGANKDGDASGMAGSGGGETNATSPVLHEASTPIAGEAVAAVTPEAVPDGPLSFRDHMWSRFDWLWQRRVEPSLKLLEEMASMLRSRAKLERAYANSLVGFQNQVKLDPESSATVHGAVSTVLVNFKNRGEQSRELADQIDQEIAVIFEDVGAQHRSVASRMHSDMSVLFRYCQDTMKAHSRLSARYGQRCAEAELLAREVLQSIAMKSSERMKTAMKVATLGIQARQAEAEYYAGLNEANKARAIYEAHLAIVLQGLQDIEERSSLCLRDGLRKLAVFELSWLRNMQYDLEATVQASEGADPAADLQNFLRNAWNEQGRRAPASIGDGAPGAAPPPRVSVQPFWELGRAKVPRDTPQRRQLREDDTALRNAYTELQPLIKTILEEQGGTTQVPDPVALLTKGMADHKRRAALCSALRGYVLSRAPQGTEIDNAKSICIDLIALEALAQIFVAALDACDEPGDCDVWNGRDFMVLTQAFKAETEGGKQTSLLSRVYSHKLWSKVPFWEDVLFLGICEAYMAEVLWRRNMAPGHQLLNPSMTSFLEKFVGHMLAFGIGLEEARSAVSATIRKHATMLGPMGKAYELSLLQAYEASAAPGAAAAPAVDAAVPATAAEAPADAFAPPPRTGTEASNVEVAAGAGNGAGASGQPEEDEEEDDFEAVALGLPATSQGVEGRTHSDVFG